MVAAAVGALTAGFTEIAPHLMAGLDGMALDQFTQLGRFWSAFIAALVLLIIIHAERNNGEIALFAAIGEFARRAAFLGAAAIMLGLVNIVLGFGQELVRETIWAFWQTSSASQFHEEPDLFRVHLQLRHAAAVDHPDDPDPRIKAILYP